MSSRSTSSTHGPAPTRCIRSSTSAWSTAAAAALGTEGPHPSRATSDQRPMRRSPSRPTPSAMTGMPPSSSPNRASQAAGEMSNLASGASVDAIPERTNQAASQINRCSSAGSTPAKNSPSRWARRGRTSRSGVSASTTSRRPRPGIVRQCAPLQARRRVQRPPGKTSNLLSGLGEHRARERKAWRLRARRDQGDWIGQKRTTPLLSSAKARFTEVEQKLQRPSNSIRPSGAAVGSVIDRPAAFSRRASPASCRGWRRSSGRSSPPRRFRCHRKWSRGS